MGVMWLASAAVSAPFLVMAKTMVVPHAFFPAPVPVCITNNAPWERIYLKVKFVLVFVLPFCLLVFLYSSIIRKVRAGLSLFDIFLNNPVYTFTIFHPFIALLNCTYPRSEVQCP